RWDTHRCRNSLSVLGIAAEPSDRKRGDDVQLCLRYYECVEAAEGSIVESIGCVNLRLRSVMKRSILAFVIAMVALTGSALAQAPERGQGGQGQGRGGGRGRGLPQMPPLTGPVADMV